MLVELVGERSADSFILDHAQAANFQAEYLTLSCALMPFTLSTESLLTMLASVIAANSVAIGSGTTVPFVSVTAPFELILNRCLYLHRL